MHSNKKAIPFVMAFLLSFFSINPAYADVNSVTPKLEKKQTVSTKKSSKVYFSLADKYGGADKKAITEFGCEDKIFTVVELSNYKSGGPYQLSVKWINPNGEVQEHTKYPFHISKNETRLWAWISLLRATGAGMMQWLNPAAGLEEFIGEWEVKVKINGKTIDSQNFQVIC